jgi:parvulin-like peptidyl-prolyl isomerase
MRSRTVVLLALSGFLVAGFPAQAKEPDQITVQHILIGFKYTIPNKPLERTKKEAKALAYELLDRAQAGEDFDKLVEQYTNDTVPGIMLVTNHDAPRVAGGRTRRDLVPKFGDVAFRLEVGEVGIANFNTAVCPYGWHIIKRLE